MRKVTASAVILTAITGCSQSEAPSSQWSFEVPSASQAAQQSEASALLADAFASRPQQSLSEPSSAQFSSAESTTFDPSGNASALSPDKPTSDSELGALAEETATFNASSLLNPVVSTRADPLASVRSYLNATSSISDIVNRVPYSSQVYLPPAPVYTSTAVPAAISTAVPVTETSTWPQPQEPSLFAGVNPAPISADAIADAAQIVAGFADDAPAVFPVSQALTSADVSSPTALPTTSPLAAAPPLDPVSLTLSPTEERYISQRYVETVLPDEGSFGEGNDVGDGSIPTSMPTVAIQDTLPVLEAAADPVSTGTAILRTLAENGDSEAAAALTAVTELESGLVEFLIEDDGSEVAEASSTGVESTPTLARLLSTMSRVEESPIVTSFEVVPRGSQNLSRAADNESLVGSTAEQSTARRLITERSAASNGVPIQTFQPLPLELPLPNSLLPDAPLSDSAEFSAEAVPVEVGGLETDVTKAGVLETEVLETEALEMELLRSETVPDTAAPSVDPLADSSLPQDPMLHNSSPEAANDMRPNGYDSPLLESLAIAEQSIATLPTVYVPIPEVSENDISALFIREAIASLGSEFNAESDAHSESLSALEARSQDVMSAALVRFGEDVPTVDIAAENSDVQKPTRLKKSLKPLRRTHQLTRYRQRIVWQ